MPNKKLPLNEGSKRTPSLGGRGTIKVNKDAMNEGTNKKVIIKRQED